MQTNQSFRVSGHRLIANLASQDHRQLHPIFATVIVRGMGPRAFFAVLEVKNEYDSGRSEYEGTRERRVSSTGVFLATVSFLASILEPPHCKPQRNKENLAPPA